MLLKIYSSAWELQGQRDRVSCVLFTGRLPVLNSAGKLGQEGHRQRSTSTGQEEHETIQGNQSGERYVVPGLLPGPERSSNVTLDVRSNLGAGLLEIFIVILMRNLLDATCISDECKQFPRQEGRRSAQWIQNLLFSLSPMFYLNLELHIKNITTKIECLWKHVKKNKNQHSLKSVQFL